MGGSVLGSARMTLEDAPSGTSRCIRWVFFVVLAWALGAIVVAIGMAFWSLTGDRPERISGSHLQVSPSQMSVVEGSVQRLPGGALRLDEVGHEGRLVVLFSPQSGVSDKPFESLRVDLDSPAPLSRVRLVWRGEGQSMRAHPLTGAPPYTVELGQLPGWSGSPEWVGLMFSGTVEGARLHGLTFERPTPSRREVLRLLVDGWWSSAPVSQSSINVVQVGPSAPLPFAVVPVLGLLASASALGLLLVLSRGLPVGRMMLVLFISWWLVFDLRWQWDLWAEHSRTLEQFGGVEVEDRSHEGLGGSELLELVNLARKNADGTSRVFVISPSEALGLYARYRLMPARGYATESLSRQELQRIRDGEQIVLMGRSNVLLHQLRVANTGVDGGFPSVGWAPDSAPSAEGSDTRASRSGILREEDSHDGFASWITEDAIPVGLYRVTLDLSRASVTDLVRFRVESTDGLSNSRSIVLDRAHSLREEDLSNGVSALFLLEEGDQLRIVVSNTAEGSVVRRISVEAVSPEPDWFRVSLDGGSASLPVKMVGRNDLGIVLEVLP